VMLISVAVEAAASSVLIGDVESAVAGCGFVRAAYTTCSISFVSGL
jgi:hypothetical protein